MADATSELIQTHCCQKEEDLHVWTAALAGIGVVLVVFAGGGVVFWRKAQKPPPDILEWEPVGRSELTGFFLIPVVVCARTL